MFSPALSPRLSFNLALSLLPPHPPTVPPGVAKLIQWVALTSTWSASANLAICAIIHRRKNLNLCIVTVIGLSWLSYECYTSQSQLSLGSKWPPKDQQSYCQCWASQVLKGLPILRLHNVAGQRVGDLGGFKSKEVLQQGQFMRVNKCQVIKRRRLPYKCYQVSMWPSFTVFAHITLKILKIQYMYV